MGKNLKIIKFNEATSRVGEIFINGYNQYTYRILIIKSKLRASLCHPRANE